MYRDLKSFNRVIAVVLRETTLTISDSIDTAPPIVRSKSRKFFDDCQVKNFNFSTFRGNFFARKVEVTVPNFYFSSSS